MYQLLFDNSFIYVSKEKFFEFIDFYSKTFEIVKCLTCSNSLLFVISDESNGIWCYVGQTDDPDYLLPYQEAMFD